MRISFAKSLTNRNVLLQELCQIEPGRHVVRISSFEAFDKHDNSVLELAFRLVCRLLSDFVSSVSDEYSLHWLDKLFCSHSKMVVDWQLPV